MFLSYGQVSPNQNRKTPLSAPSTLLTASQQGNKYATDAKSYIVPNCVKIGETNYDLQTNATSPKRLINHGDGTFSATWIQYQGNNASAPERGSGYAFFNGSAWLYTETSGNNTIEGTRAGWPAIMSNGTNEFVVSHIVDDTDHGLFGHNQTIGSAGANWTVSPVADGTEEPMLWPRAASSGNNYYVIAVDNYDSNVDNIIEGLHFYKSDDAGTSWSYRGQLRHFKNFYLNGSGDSYSIDAKDNYVAIVYFGDLCDTRLWKSDDYGDTWTEKVIVDFPVDKFDISTGIIDCNTDGSSDTIMSTDETGDVIIDANGTVHVVFSRMQYLIVEENGNFNLSYFPATDYLLYWNDNMAEGQFDSTASLIAPNKYGLAISSEVDTIGFVPDLNWDGYKNYNSTQDNPFSFGSYGKSLTSQASLGIDDANNIYVAYSTVMESWAYRRGATSTLPSQQYRAIFLRRFDKVKGTWGKPLNITRIDGTKEENVFPIMARKVDSCVYVMYQQDNEPGISVYGDEDPTTVNSIMYKAIKTDTLTGIVDIKPEISFGIYPNPAKNFIKVSNIQNSTIKIYNLLGKEVFAIESKVNEQTIDLTALEQGTYIIKVFSDKGVANKKFIHIN